MVQQIGDNMSDKLTRKEIQDTIYNDLGIDPNSVVPTYRDKIDKSFTLDEVKAMGDDEFNHYFDMDPEVRDTPSKIGLIAKDLTYENYLKSVTPKSSFKEANKKMKAIEDAGN